MKQILDSRMTLIILAFLGASLSVSPARSNAADHVNITIVATTDLHGNIFPIDYYTNQPANRGLAKAYRIIKDVRRIQPNTLLIDSGDTIQGTPLVYYHNRISPAPPDPMMLVMSYMRYDAMCVGNHEFNFGLGVIDKARREANFPWLSANIQRRSDGSSFFTPYIVREVAGIRIGILGLTTPGIPTWENEENYAGLEFRDCVAEAQRWVPILRNQEKCDLVVIATHMGLDRNLETGQLLPQEVVGENTAYQIANSVAGVDVIFMGHTHRDVSQAFVNGVLLTQADKWAEHVAKADVAMERDVSGRWRVISKKSQTVPTDDSVVPDPEILAIAEGYHGETQKWLDTPVGTLDKDLDGRDARFADNALLDLIHRVQLEVGRADVSLAAMFKPELKIASGPISVRQIAALYVYENTLLTLEVTGQQLRAALEHAAEYFEDYRPGVQIQDLVNRSFLGYNFDTAEGVEYEIDLRRQKGSRITNLRYRGQPLSPDKSLRLAINNYRYNGGGGYSMFKGAKVLYRSSEEIRNLIIEWVRRNRKIPSEPTGNWRLLPADLTWAPHRSSSEQQGPRTMRIDTNRIGADSWD